MAASPLSILSLVLTVVALVTYIVGFACPNWISKEFTLQVPGAVFGLPPPLDTALIEVKTKAELGVVKACSEQTILIPQNTKSVTDCSSDGAKDWQKVAAGLAIAGLVFAVFSLVVCAVLVFVPKAQGSNPLQAVAVAFNILNVGLTLASLIIYVDNREIQVSPPLPDKVEFELDWAFFVTVASLALFLLLVPLRVVEIMKNPGKNECDVSKGPVVRYNK